MDSVLQKIKKYKDLPIIYQGPGAYAPKKSTFHYSTWKIGTESRIKKNHNINPGLGHIRSLMILKMVQNIL